MRTVLFVAVVAFSAFVEGAAKLRTAVFYPQNNVEVSEDNAVTATATGDLVIGETADGISHSVRASFDLSDLPSDAEVSEVSVAMRVYPFDKAGKEPEVTMLFDDEVLSESTSVNDGNSHFFPSTPKFRETVQELVQSKKNNFGILFVAHNSEEISYRRYHSVGNKVESRRPRMIVKYSSSKKTTDSERMFLRSGRVLQGETGDDGGTDGVVGDGVAPSDDGGTDGVVGDGVAPSDDGGSDGVAGDGVASSDDGGTDGIAGDGEAPSDDGGTDGVGGDGEVPSDDGGSDGVGGDGEVPSDDGGTDGAEGDGDSEGSAPITLFWAEDFDFDTKIKTDHCSSIGIVDLGLTTGTVFVHQGKRKFKNCDFNQSTQVTVDESGAFVVKPTSPSDAGTVYVSGGMDDCLAGRKQKFVFAKTFDIVQGGCDPAGLVPIRTKVLNKVNKCRKSCSRNPRCLTYIYEISDGACDMYDIAITTAAVVADDTVCGVVESCDRSADDGETSSDSDSAPADDGEASTDSDSAPADDGEASTDSDSAPADDGEASTDSDSAPADDGEASTDSDSAPADDGEASTDSDSAPADDGEASTDSDSAPADDGEASTDSDSAP